MYLLQQYISLKKLNTYIVIIYHAKIHWNKLPAWCWYKNVLSNRHTFLSQNNYEWLLFISILILLYKKSISENASFIKYYESVITE